MPSIGRIKTSPEDFRVEEIPAYEPSGEGEHLFVHFEKRGLTTDEVVRAFAAALGIDKNVMGVPGLKDKNAVTTQWISIPAPLKDDKFDPRVRELVIPGVTILEAKRHGNKLKTGHLHGNRFDIVVRGVTDVAAATAALEKIGKEGVPNHFGSQRFGKANSTVEQAREWLTGKKRAPQNPRLRRFHFSALQSEIFNAVLDARIADGTWNVPVLGDVLKKEDTGGLFLCTDVQVDRERALKREVGPTGPMPGEKMRQPEGDVLALETRIAEPLLEGIDLHRARALGEGTRRALRLLVDSLSIAQVMDSEGEAGREQAGALRVRFVLPKGAYATTVLAGAFDLSEAQAAEETAGSDTGSDSQEPAQTETKSEEA